MLNAEALRQQYEETEGFSPRGIGANSLECFICHEGGDETIQPDMAAFVESKETGERIVEMFARTGVLAHLDFRDYEPNWVQVKVGSCDTHLPKLQALQDATKTARMISQRIIEQALGIHSPLEPRNTA